MNLAHDQEDGPITVIVTRIAKKAESKNLSIRWTELYMSL
jgi:hypothetical protein